MIDIFFLLAIGVACWDNFCFDRTVSPIISSNQWGPMTVRGEMGVQTQKKEGSMAGQVRKEKVLAQGVVIGGGGGAERMVLSILFRDKRVVKSQVSDLQHRNSSEVAWKAFAGPCPQEMRAVGWRRRRYLMEKIICWRFQSPMGQRGRVARPARQSREDGK